MEDEAKEIEVEEIPKRVGGCSSKDVDFNVEVENNDEETQFT